MKIQALYSTTRLCLLKVPTTCLFILWLSLLFRISYDLESFDNKLFDDSACPATVSPTCLELSAQTAPKSTAFYASCSDLCLPDFKKSVKNLDHPSMFLDALGSIFTQPFLSLYTNFNVLDQPDLKSSQHLVFKSDIAIYQPYLPAAIVFNIRMNLLRHIVTKQQFSALFGKRRMSHSSHLGGGRLPTQLELQNESKALWEIPLSTEEVLDHLPVDDAEKHFSKLDQYTMVGYVDINSPEYSVWRDDIESGVYFLLDMPFSALLNASLSHNQLLQFASHHLRRRIKYLRASTKEVVLKYLKQHICTECKDFKIICQRLPAMDLDKSPKQEIEDGLLRSGEVCVSMPFEYVQAFSLFKHDADEVSKSHDCFELSSYKTLPCAIDSTAWNSAWNRLGYVALDVPLKKLLNLGLKRSGLIHVAKMHSIPKANSMTKAMLTNLLQYHECDTCPQMLSMCRGISKNMNVQPISFPPNQNWKQLWEE